MAGYKSVARKIRLRTLREAKGGRKASKIAASGVLKAAEFGAAINGISDREFLTLQRVALAGSSPKARGRSRTAFLAINGDATWQANLAPVL